MGKGWVREPEQEMFLKQRLPEFSKAQRKKRVARFFGNVFEAWFKKYPERNLLFGADRNLDTLMDDEKEALTEAIFQRKEQLRSYFYWHTPSRHTRNDGQTNFSWLVELLTGKHTKGAPRQKKLLDVYSKMFYKTKIRDELDKRMKAAYPSEFGVEKKSSLYHSRRFSLLHRLKKEMWAEEPAEVHRLVEEERKKLAQRGEDEDDETREPNDLDVVKGIEAETKNLPAVLDKIAKAVMERTGFATTILMGGIQHDGTLSGTVIHSGKTAEGGLTFQDTMIDFEEAVLDPWGRFLERVYPPSKRKAQADFYNNAYKVTNAGSEVEAGHVLTEVWGSGDDKENEHEDEEGEGRLAPNKEIPSTTEVPNEEITTGNTLSLNTSLAVPILQNTQTVSNVCAAATPTMSISAATFASSISAPMTTDTPTTTQIPPNLGLIHGSGANPPPSVDHNNTLGLRLPAPNEREGWEQPNRFTSMSDEFNFAMAGVDMDFSIGLGGENTLDNHAALLRQNSMPHGGVGITYDDNVGMSNQDWHWLGIPPTTNLSSSINNYSDAFPPVNPVSFQTDSTQNVSAFNLTTAMLSADSNLTWSRPTLSPVNADTSNMQNQLDGPPGAPANNGASSSPSTSFTSNSSVSNESQECASDPDQAEARTCASVVLSANEEASEQVSANEEASEQATHQDSSPLPLQEIPSNMTRRLSGRQRKRKLHRDAEFEKEQEAREVKRKKGGIQVQARKQNKATR